MGPKGDLLLHFWTSFRAMCFVKDRTNLEDRLASLRAGEKHVLRLGMLFLLGIEAVWVTSVGAF